jgi:hypothetical protein
MRLVNKPVDGKNNRRPRPISSRQGSLICAINIWSFRWPKATDTRTKGTSDHSHRPCAICPLSNRQADVNRTNNSTQLTTRGFRTLKMATRTSTTRTMSSRCEPSADTNAGTCLAPFPFSDLVQAYFDCRKSKRKDNTHAIAT